jgi:hypothetical protein
MKTKPGVLDAPTSDYVLGLSLPEAKKSISALAEVRVGYLETGHGLLEIAINYNKKACISIAAHDLLSFDSPGRDALCTVAGLSVRGLSGL